MNKITVGQAADWLNAELIGSRDIELSSVVRDNRDVVPGSLFAALKGEVHDGHRFAADSLARGAAALLLEKGNAYNDELKPSENQAMLLVGNTTEALQLLAHCYRMQFSIPVVGVTGSVGKTSCKDLTAAALAGRYRVLKTAGNYNNEIGLPLTLFNFESDTEAAVLEMGMDHAGQIELLSKIAEPHYGIVTNVGLSHIENFENQEGILNAKLEIVRSMDRDGILFINGDDPLLISRKNAQPVKTESFGFGEDNEGRILDATVTEEGTLAVKLSYRGEEYAFTLATPGRHMALNAAPAVMLAVNEGLTREEIIRGIESASLTEKRLQIRKSSRYTVIDDSYNASPDSMCSALKTLAVFPGDARRVAILGDMFEMGSFATAGHKRVGHEAALNDKLDILICVGEESVHMADEAVSAAYKAGNEKLRVFYYEDLEALFENLPELIEQDDIILVKASHGMHFDTVCDRLLAEA